MEDVKQIRCVKCGSTFNYLRIKDNQRVCRTCGHVEDLKEEE